MTDDRDPLAVFEDHVIGDVATESGADPAVLRDRVRHHQVSMRELPGIEDLVYEWRNLFHRDPLVERTDAAYVLVVREHVWEEFGDRLELTADELEQLRAVHARQAREYAENTDRLDDDEPIVLTRP